MKNMKSHAGHEKDAHGNTTGSKKKEELRQKRRQYLLHQAREATPPSNWHPCGSIATLAVLPRTEPAPPAPWLLVKMEAQYTTQPTLSYVNPNPVTEVPDGGSSCVLLADENGPSKKMLSIVRSGLQVE